MVRLNVLSSPGPATPIPARTVSHMSGGRDLWSDPLRGFPADPEEAIRACLSEVLDPEIPISLIDLGLIYGVVWSSGCATIRVSYTATACPCMEFIREDIRDRLEREPWIREVEILDVWDPPWTRERITPHGRLQLRELGVGA